MRNDIAPSNLGYFIAARFIPQLQARSLLGTPQAAAFEAEHQLLGSRDLFRTSFALEREFGPRYAAQLYWAHMSHGQILDEGRNQGLDYVGVRFIYRLDTDAAD